MEDGKQTEQERNTSSRSGLTKYIFRHCIFPIESEPAEAHAEVVLMEDRKSSAETLDEIGYDDGGIDYRLDSYGQDIVEAVKKGKQLICASKMTIIAKLEAKTNRKKLAG